MGPGLNGGSTSSARLRRGLPNVLKSAKNLWQSVTITKYWVSSGARAKRT
ncbi:hypothetical protein EVS84_26300 [Pseudomonas koreensis]|uniref:Uncharacterized protein n=1 Tax=Pseudomonas koreensis TaxID=198620 RepID=A0A4Q4KYR6_9PSED|nr:hypothetical protein EVS84_26300 [Pseudomonas koreensis]